MQKMSNGDYFDEKMRRGDRSKEARRISPPLKLLLKSPKLRGSTAPKSAHLHRGREQGARAFRAVNPQNLTRSRNSSGSSSKILEARVSSTDPGQKVSWKVTHSDFCWI